jgi:hypothetical protein
VASRKEQKEALRAQRLEQEQAAASSARRRRLLGYGLGGLIAVVAVAVLVWLVLVTSGGGDAPAGPSQEFPSGSVPPVRERDLEAAAQAAGCEVDSHRTEGQEHVGNPVDYRSNPPHSGNHTPDWVEDGAYSTPTDPKEKFVHALEHGRIHIEYRQGAPNPLKGSLKALYDEDPYHMILSPNLTDMPYEVAATTWTKSLTCPRANDRVYDAIRAFKTAYRDRGPEFIP